MRAKRCARLSSIGLKLSLKGSEYLENLKTLLVRTGHKVCQPANNKGSMQGATLGDWADEEGEDDGENVGEDVDEDVGDDEDVYDYHLGGIQPPELTIVPPSSTVPSYFSFRLAQIIMVFGAGPEILHSSIQNTIHPISRPFSFGFL